MQCTTILINRRGYELDTELSDADTVVGYERAGRNEIAAAKFLVILAG